MAKFLQEKSTIDILILILFLRLMKFCLITYNSLCTYLSLHAMYTSFKFTCLNILCKVIVKIYKNNMTMKCDFFNRPYLALL